MNDEPTQITPEDIDIVVKNLMEGCYAPQKEKCLKCCKEFFPNYARFKCDECFFAQFPKEEVMAFYRSFFE